MYVYDNLCGTQVWHQRKLSIEFISRFYKVNSIFELFYRISGDAVKFDVDKKMNINLPIMRFVNTCKNYLVYTHKQSCKTTPLCDRKAPYASVHFKDVFRKALNI